LISDWAAVVYGRTYEVDFRLLAIPHDLTPPETLWISQRIQVMTRSAEDLPDAPRWGLFSQDGLCVVGASCMVQELLSATEAEFAYDRLGRPLFVFVGYVGRMAQTIPAIPAYLDRDLRSFRVSYLEYVVPNWTVKSYEERSRTPLLTEYRSLQYLPVEVADVGDQAELALSLPEKRQIFLYPDTEQIRQNLWRLAAARLSASQSVSICLGLSRSSDAIDGSFLNATVADITEKRILIEVNSSSTLHPTTIVAQPPSSRTSSTPQRSTVFRFLAHNHRHIILLGIVEVLIGAFLGGLIGLIFFQGLSLSRLLRVVIIGTLGGAGLTLLLQWLQRQTLTEDQNRRSTKRSLKGIFLAMLKRLDRRANALEAPKSDAKPPKPMYGFNEKVNRDDGDDGDGFNEWR